MQYAGRQLVSPFAPRGAQKLDGERCASREQEPSEAIHKAAPMASRLSSAHGPTRPQMRDDGSDEDFLPFESQRKSGPRSGSHARESLNNLRSAGRLASASALGPSDCFGSCLLPGRDAQAHKCVPLLSACQCRFAMSF